jgi:hypothetical protein
LTLSFAPDGTNAGGTPSTLFQLLNSQVSTTTWEMAILRAFQTWAVNTNVNIGLISDQGQALGTTGAAEGDQRFGDIRIAAKNISPTAVSTAQPFSWSGTTWSGDVLLNNLYKFGVGKLSKGQYDLFTIALHEAGHALGLGDDNVDSSSAMYDAYIGPRTGLSSQDIADIQALYGVRQADRFEANNSFASAAYTDNSPSDLAFSADITSQGEADYFKIVTPSSFLGLLGASSFTVQIKTAGVSLLVPKIYVYNAAYQVVGSASASSPLNNNLTVTVANPVAGATYYFRVAGNSPDVFGVGSYQVDITYQSLTNVITGILNPVLPVVGNTLSTALQLAPAFPNKQDNRFDYLYRATIALPAQTDYYQIQSPNAAAGTSFTMHTLAWELSPNGLHPIIHAFDAFQNPIPVQILGNSDGLYSIQIQNLSPGTVYYLEVTALNPLGPNNLGSYGLGVKFDTNSPVVLSTLAANTLPSQTSVITGTLTMNQDGLFHLSLGTSNGSTSASADVTLTIYDQCGNVVLTLDSLTGQPPATAVVYLSAGTYTTRLSVRSSSGTFQPVNYWLSGEILSDPIGPYQSNPTNSSTGSSSGSGGYSYSGSPTSSSPPGNPTYY